MGQVAGEFGMQQRIAVGCVLAWLATIALPVECVAANSTDVRDNGQRIFDGSCARCHGFDGFGAIGPSLQRSEITKPGNDAALQAIVVNGIPARGMPPTAGLSPQEIEALVGYVHQLRSVDSTAWSQRAARGQAIYRKLDCSSCHVIAGQGRGVGPELTRIGIARKTAELHRDLVEPAASSPKAGSVIQYLPVRVVTSAGQEISGLRINEDAFSIQLRDANDGFHTFKKSALSRIDKHYETSLMPSYKLSAAEMDDLVAYLSSLRGTP
jgi:putative heme-binding domain-containing protein